MRVGRVLFRKNQLYGGGKAMISGYRTLVILIAILAFLVGSGGAFAVTTGGVASASAYYGDNYPAKAFDGNTTTSGWGSPNYASRWLRYDFYTPKVVTNYRYICSSSQSGGWSGTYFQPKEYTIQGSDDGTNWTVLTSVTNGPAGQNVWRSYPLTNTVAYAKYRFYITKNTGNDNPTYGTYVQLTELELDGYFAPAGAIFYGW